MFASFDTADTGLISLDEFICGLAVLKHGTDEERHLFLFNVLDADRDGYITRRDVTELASVLEKAGVQHLDPEQTWSEMLAVGDTKVEARRFGSWASTHRRSPLVRRNPFTLQRVP